MGGGHSRELEAAQGHVKRLLKDVKRLGVELETSQKHLSKARTEASELPTLRSSLSTVQMELNAAKGASAEVPRLKQQVASAREDLLRAKSEAQGEQAHVKQLKAELEASKTELEQVFGKAMTAVECEVGAAEQVDLATSIERVARHMLERGQGRIITVSSVAALKVYDEGAQAMYATAKAGLHHYTKHLGENDRLPTLAPFSLGSTVGLLSPCSGWLEDDLGFTPLALCWQRASCRRTG